MKNTNNISETLNIKLIIEYIEKNSLTRKEFCQQCKISISTFYRIINGKDFRLDALFKIAKIMNLKLYQFF